MTTREEWLEQRRSGLGASDVAVALGVSPYRSQWQLWAEKTGIAEPEDLSGNAAVQIGVALEGLVLDLYSRQSGRVVERWPQYEIVRDVTRPWLFCTPDATQDYECGGLVEIKTAGNFAAAEWDEGPPLHYECQLQTQLAVTGYTSGTIAVLFTGSRELRWYDRERDDRFIAAMLPRLEEFWQLVEKRIPPPVDGSMATANALARLYPQDYGETVQLPAAADEWIEALEQAKRDIKDAEERKLAAENLLKAAIGEASAGWTPSGVGYSWKTQQRVAYTVDAGSMRVLRRITTK